jgi:hypothetical protein
MTEKKDESRELPKEEQLKENENQVEPQKEKVEEVKEDSPEQPAEETSEDNSEVEVKAEAQENVTEKQSEPEAEEVKTESDPENFEPEKIESVKAEADTEEDKEEDTSDKAQEPTANTLKQEEEQELGSQGEGDAVEDIKDEDTSDKEQQPVVVTPEEEEETEKKSQGKTGAEEGKESSDEELVEEYEFEEEEEEEDEDYEKLSKEELLDRIKEVTGKDLEKISEKKVDAIQEAFFQKVDQDRDNALQEFLKDEESKEEDFEYSADNELIQQFKTYYKGFREQKRKHIGDLNKLKEDNLKKKEELLEKLRQFVDEDEDNVSVKTLKEIEEEWKQAEPIPSNFNRELWANFNALRDRFYDKRSIFFELKELDRKKNQTLKEEVIKRAKELLDMDPVNAAVAELKKLHEEYKHIGPVPKEIRPVLWDEFKKISDQIHERKQEVAAEFKQKLDENLEKKKELILKLEGFVDYTSEKISDWNEKSREILDIQEQWKKVGPVPRELSKEISKSFWTHFKGFFKNKQQFFKQLDAEREKNYEAKEKLCEEVEEINKLEEDQASHSDKVKELQRKWKEIGPAPRKKSEVVYKRFKQACDIFFDNLRGHQKEVEKDFEVNLEKKNAIVEKIKSFKELSEENVEEAEALIKEWVETGFVPKKAIRSSKAAIHDGVDELLKKAKDFSEEQKDVVSTKLKALLMKADFQGSRNIRGQMDKIRRQISKLQDDTVTLKTNMEFFASTKNAEKLKDDVQKKIDQEEQQNEKLKNKIKLLRQIDG